MPSVWKVFKWLFMVIGSFYIVESALNLMTYPSDFSFWGGVAMLAFLALGWIELGYHVFQSIKEKNEKPKVDVGDTNSNNG